MFEDVFLAVLLALYLAGFAISIHRHFQNFFFSAGGKKVLRYVRLYYSQAVTALFVVFFSLLFAFMWPVIALLWAYGRFKYRKLTRIK